MECQKIRQANQKTARLVFINILTQHPDLHSFLPQPQIMVSETCADTRQEGYGQELQMQLQRQIEVKRHLQLRIEAQGKYLYLVLKKAQETLAGYNCSSENTYTYKSELFETVSMVKYGCQNSSVPSDLKETKITVNTLRADMRKRIGSTLSDANCVELDDQQAVYNPKGRCSLRSI